MPTAPAQRPARSKSPAPENAKKDKGETKAPAAGNKNLIIGGVVVAVLVGLYFTVGQQVNLKEIVGQAVKFVEDQGQAAVIWYCVFTFVGVVCLVPTTPMELAGGFLFSPIYGVVMVCVFTGVTKLLGNIVSVLIARFLIREWVKENIVQKYDLLKMVSEAVKEEPWKMCFLVRGSMVPLSVKNYGLGVMEVGYLPIAACSMIFTNFYASQNIYMGSAMQNIAEVFAPKAASAGPTDWTGMAKKMMPIAFNILLVVFLVKAVKAQIKKQRSVIEVKLKEKENNKKK